MRDRCSGRMKRLCAVFWLAVFCLLLSGCGAGFPFAEEEEKPQEYTKPQAMIIVATERNRYEKVYTDQIWEVTLADGRTFEVYLLEQVKEFLTNLKAMKLLAEEQGLSLTSAEQSRLKALSSRYYEGLTDQDLEYTGVTEEDALLLYQDYYLANKAVGLLTAGMIQISSEAAAEAVYRRVSQKGSDFLAVARETSEGDQIELSLGRGELPKAAEDAAFALASGEMSSLIECEGWYYIFQCVSDYDEDATQLRKTRIYEERKNQVFQQIYSQSGMDAPAVFSDDYWPEIRLTGDDGSTTTDFFLLYEEEFGS